MPLPSSFELAHTPNPIDPTESCRLADYGGTQQLHEISHQGSHTVSELSRCSLVLSFSPLFCFFRDKRAAPLQIFGDVFLWVDFRDSMFGAPGRSVPAALHPGQACQECILHEIWTRWILLALFESTVPCASGFCSNMNSQTTGAPDSGQYSMG